MNQFPSARHLETMGTPSLDVEIAQFHCELAQEALQQKKPDEARRQLGLALKANEHNVRATILAGDVDAASGNWESALVQWQRVEAQNPAYLPLVAEKVMKGYEALGRAHDGAQLLTEWVDRHSSNDLLDVAYKYVSELSGPEAAHTLARTQMQKSPNLAGMTRLLEAQQAAAEEPRRSELELMRKLIQQRTKNLPRYTCQNCGFRARLFYWQCPGCSGWETYAPRRVEPIPASS